MPLQYWQIKRYEKAEEKRWKDILADKKAGEKIIRQELAFRLSDCAFSSRFETKDLIDAAYNYIVSRKFKVSWKETLSITRDLHYYGTFSITLTGGKANA